jgi:putative transcriptional regulator
MAKRVKTHKTCGSPTYKSTALAVIHENAADLHEAGALDPKTMRKFDRACLSPLMTLTPSAIWRIRRK